MYDDELKKDENSKIPRVTRVDGPGPAGLVPLITCQEGHRLNPDLV